MKKELRIYRTPHKKEPFTEWIEGLEDRVGRAQVTNRLNRIISGNYGDCKAVGEGVHELRVDYGPGYRVYFAEHEMTLVLLLVGGSKKTQERDIKKAKEYWIEFKERYHD